jgi:hypothetical protein
MKLTKLAGIVFFVMFGVITVERVSATEQSTTIAAIVA